MKEIFSPTLTQANVLELRWTATPTGLRAIEELGKLERSQKERAASRTGKKAGDRQ